jgi:hypothetical protein
MPVLALGRFSTLSSRAHVRMCFVESRWGVLWRRGVSGFGCGKARDWRQWNERPARKGVKRLGLLSQESGLISRAGHVCSHYTADDDRGA